LAEARAASRPPGELFLRLCEGIPSWRGSKSKENGSKSKLFSSTNPGFSVGCSDFGQKEFADPFLAVTSEADALAFTDPSH